MRAPLFLLPLALVAILVPDPGLADDEAPPFQMVHTGPGLSLHKEMYALPATYCEEYHGRRTEAVFQISAKYRVFDTRVYFAYTQISFWQSYDYRNSSPFRDTNYNPEIFYRFAPIPRGGGDLSADAGIEHESNGQLLPASRSWNLVYFAPWYRHGNLLVYAKARYRIPEKAKTSPDDPEGDDNPDITDYLGYSDLDVYYRFPGRQMLHGRLRGVLGNGKGIVSLNASVPLPHDEHGYVVLRLSHGYGESLMDYKRSISRVGIGIMFTR